MSTSYTPGPWFAKRDRWSTVYIEARIVGGWLQEVAACGPTEAGPDQQDANARLIAEAPCLLDVAIALRQHLALFCGPDDPIANELFDLADAAIARAKGETP